MTQDELSDHPGGYRHEQIVRTVLDPVVAPWGRRKMVPTPVVHHVVSRAILRRHAGAPLPTAVRPRTAVALHVRTTRTVLRPLGARRLRTVAGTARMPLAVWPPLLCMAALLPVIPLAGVVVGLRDGNG